MGSQPSSCDVVPSENALIEDTITCSNKVKKRELLLEDVGIGTQLSTSIKGKRSERDRDGKGQASSRGGNKIGRPSLSNANKPKEKPTQISSASVRIPEHPKPSLPARSSEANGDYNNNNLEEALEEDTEPFLDLSQLQIPDGLGGPDDFDTQPGDISSWFNLDDDDGDGDFDITELAIPMDDLSGLNIKF